jgi:hypothetical protein
MNAILDTMQMAGFALFVILDARLAQIIRYVQVVPQGIALYLLTVVLQDALHALILSVGVALLGITWFQEFASKIS